MSLVLLVDDVPAMAEQYAFDLERLGGYRTQVAASGAEALRILAAEPVDCMILDLEMPGMDGFAVLRQLAHRGIELPVIVYTGTGNFERCVQAVRLGAWGFIDKAEPMERVAREVENALRHRTLTSRVRELEAREEAETPLVGTGPAMGRLRTALARVAPIPSPVLILGESGTGKELVARELHRLGAHPGEPFLALNAGALPEALVESELFGHEKGAFTGATATRRGAFESAGQGTLFLDEIGELPPAAQAKLLRVVETREVTRVGGARPVPVAARVVAATHRDLDADVREGRFREDLLFRLNVHVLRVPPLRERLEDLPDLAARLVESIAPRLGLPPRPLAPATLAALAAYDWRRNNVRELRNVLERMLIASDSPVLAPEDIPVELRGGGEGGVGTPPAGEGAADGDGTFAERRAEAERTIIREALRRHDGHVTRTAAALGLADHASLLKIMRRLGVERDVE
jgi:two-component system, NtrC family, nitrogen regulation response regulator NtrX